MKKVSIIIPVFNAEKYINKCMDSVLGQVYKNIEIICVDDASTDDSLKIIEQYVNCDRRIKCVKLNKNSGGYIARKCGAEAASGDYILFADADDYMDYGLIDELISLAEDKDFDIIQFSSEVEDCGVGEECVKGTQKFVMPLCEELYGNDIFSRCFCIGDYGFNLCDKLFKASMCKKVFSLLEDCYVYKANDLFIYFFMAAEAQSYAGYVTKYKYHYRFGNGDSLRRNISSKDFEKYCDYGRVLECIRSFADKIELSVPKELIEKATAGLGERLLRETTETWLLNVEEAEKTKALAMFAEAWGFVEMTDIIRKAFPAYKNVFAKHILEGKLLPKNFRISKKIAFYYRKYGQGGVERVISLLIPLFMEAGYGVVLITETEREKDDFPLPEQVKRYTIPANLDINSEKIRYRERAYSLIDIYRKEQIDTICYQEASSPYLLYDLIITKSAGVKFILSKHELFSQHFVCNLDVLTDEIVSYPLVDALTVLSSEEEAFWKLLGVQSVLIPNPLTVKRHNAFQYNSGSHDIVWIGRLDCNQKQYQDIVPIMKEVVRDIPDATLRIYGSPNTFNDAYLLESQLSEAHLEENIKYMGYTNQIQEIFADAGVMLMTSAYESSPMVILEGKQFGMPIVLYSMPYIETLKNGKGFLAVNQGDTIAAARAIVRILTDTEYRVQLSNESAGSLDSYSDDDVIARWRELLSGNLCCETSSDDIYGNIIRTMIFHMSLGCNKYWNLNKKYKELLTEKKIQQIKHISGVRRLKVALYPFGALGKKLLETLNSAQIDVPLIIDNRLAGKGNAIVSISDLKKVNVKEYLFVISSDNRKIYEEIRNEIREVVPEENIYDFYPINEE